MNPISEEQWRAWLEWTQNGPEEFPYEFAIGTLNKTRGDTQSRLSLETFLAGWQAGYWTDRNPADHNRHETFS